MPDLAILGKQCPHGRSVAANLQGLPRLRTRRPDPCRRNYQALEGDSTLDFSVAASLQLAVMQSPANWKLAAIKTMTQELRRKVLDLYKEVDSEVAAAGPVCVASGRCCRFK